jgi:hypothetical protein
MPEERPVKKTFKIIPEEKSPLDSQERGDWTMLKITGTKRLEKNNQGYRRLEIGFEGDQGPTATVELMELRKEEEKKKKTTTKEKRKKKKIKRKIR